MVDLPKILIVDDVPENLISLESILEDLDAEVIKADSGLEALEIVLKHDFALILLDIQMPELNGFETAKYLRSIDKTKFIPIIFLTAIAKEEKYLFQGYDAGAVDFIHKPIDDKILINKTSIFLEIYQQRQTISRLADSSLRFVPKEFLLALGKTSIMDIYANEAVQKDITVLFSDIRSFTTMSENMNASKLINFLNEYTQCMNPIIHDHNGFIDKFIGDAIMAIFPTPSDAVIASVTMQNALKQFNEDQIAKDNPAISTGIGLNSGVVMMGTLGSKTRLETTVIGDAVNLASRLEGLTKFYDANIIISDLTYQAIPHDSIHIRELDLASVKGKKKPIRLFQVLDVLPESTQQSILDSLPHYQKGIDLYRKGHFKDAMALFQQCLSTLPNDRVFELYRSRCENYITSPPAGEWNGVTAFDHK